MKPKTCNGFTKGDKIRCLQSGNHEGYCFRHHSQKDDPKYIKLRLEMNLLKQTQINQNQEFLDNPMRSDQLQTPIFSNGSIQSQQNQVFPNTPMSMDQLQTFNFPNGSFSYKPPSFNQLIMKQNQNRQIQFQNGQNNTFKRHVEDNNIDKNKRYKKDLWTN